MDWIPDSLWTRICASGSNGTSTAAAGRCILTWHQPIVAVQRGMPKHQVAMGSTLIIFAQSFSASVFLSIGQTVFESRLRINLSTDSPSADANTIITDGVAGLRTQVPAHELAGILHAYNSSITSAFVSQWPELHHTSVLISDQNSLLPSSAQSWP